MSPLRRLFVIAFWLAAGFAYISAIMPAPEAPHILWWDKFDHMAAFFTLTFLARAAYPRIPVMLLFGLLAGFGALIELSQAVPWIHRDAEWADWFADIAATIIGLILAWPFAIMADRRRSRRISPAE
ncbi:MAG TPA: teicoplanin resistance protein VanZ [Sphingomonas sp.]|nr:teicoplanin resistance protein VanZ [Sphingomonas sp.]